jgi:lipoprotein-releasing system permease protein
MLTELWLSQRYLKSRKERIISFTALISMTGIAIGVFVLIVVIAVMSGFDRYLEDKMIGANSHLLVEARGGLKESYAVIEKLKSIEHIRAAAPFISGQALFKSAEQVLIFEMRGIDPSLQPSVSRLKEYVKYGRLEMQNKELVLGQELALRLGLGLGDKINLISPVTLRETEFAVAGVFNSGMYQYDATLMLTNIKAAQDFFKMADTVSGIGIKTDDIYKVDILKDKIYSELRLSQPYELRSWIDINRNFLQALKLEKIVMFIVVTMTTVVAAFGIVGALMMSVMSKVKDIGILRSVGAKTKSILQIFIFQGLSIGLSGIVLGLAGGIWFSLGLNKIVDFISRIIGRSLIPRDIYYFERIPTYINPAEVSLIVVCALLISLAASVYPAYYASRINPAEAIRHE